MKNWRSTKLSKILKYRQRTIKNQIQVAIIFISVTSMLILGAFFYTISTDKIEHNYKEDFYYNLKISDNIINIQFDNMIELMRNLLINHSFMNTLSDAQDTEGNYFSAAQMRIIEPAVSEITLQADMVQEVLTISNDGKLYIHSKKSDISQYASLYTDKSFLEQDWANRARENKGKEVFFGRNALTGADDSISIVKCMIDTSTGKEDGFVIVNVSKKIFDKAFDNRGNYESNCFMLIDTDNENQSIYFRGNSDYQNEVYEEFLQTDVDNQQYVFCQRDSYLPGWTMVAAVQKAELNKQRKEMASLIAGLIVLLVAVGAVVSSSISRRIYGPLGKLEKTIQQVEEGKRNITEDFDTSEIGVLGTKFKEMVNHNLVLHERLLYAEIRQREQELHLLQERINPHFLYNTLDALYCMAEIHGVEDIAKMVEALSETFRLSLNKGSNLICVRDEMEHIKAYMTIENMRFNNRFQLEIQMDEILDVKILKLILEPFVENAIIHGLEPKMGGGKIILTGKREENGTILFTVKDDGVGVKDMSLLEKGYGIVNVTERIQLYYGEEYGVTFACEPGEGVTVSIRISESGMRGLRKDETNSDF